MVKGVKLGEKLKNAGWQAGNRSYIYTEIKEELRKTNAWTDIFLSDVAPSYRRHTE